MSQEFFDPELFADFIAEAKEHLETIEPNLLELEKAPDNLALLNDRRIQLASATPSKLNEKARWYSPLASPSNQRLRGVWAMHTLPGKNGTTSARQ